MACTVATARTRLNVLDERVSDNPETVQCSVSLDPGVDPARDETAGEKP
jgi:hypothetical protein